MNKDVKIGLALGFVILLVVAVYIVFQGNDNRAGEPGPTGDNTASQAGIAPDLRGGELSEADPARTGSLDPIDDPSSEDDIDERAVVASRVEPGLPESRRDAADPQEAGDPTSSELLDSILAGRGRQGGRTDPMADDEEGGQDDPAGVTRGDEGDDTRVAAGWPSFEEIEGQDDTDTRETPETTPARRFGDDPDTGAGSTAGMGLRTHTVKKGEVLSRISKTYYGTTTKWREIMKANQDLLETDRDLKPGMILVIPELDDADTGTTRTARRGTATTVDRFGRRVAVTGNTYTVQKGDTFWSIAAKRLGAGSRHSELFEANRERLNLDKPTDLRPGMEVVIPD